MYTTDEFDVSVRGKHIVKIFAEKEPSNDRIFEHNIKLIFVVDIHAIVVLDDKMVGWEEKKTG